MIIRNPAFCLTLYITGVNFRGELHHVVDVSEKKIKCGPIRTQEIGGVRLQDKLYVRSIIPMCQDRKLIQRRDIIAN